MWIDDEVIKQSFQDYALSVWVPKNIFVVFGRSNIPEKECFVDRCKNDGIPMYRRLGGGGTVLLHPGCIIISFGTWVNHYYQNDKFFKALNQSVMSLLSDHYPQLKNISQKGISDLTMGERKIAGTSLFRSRNYLLYQASILIDPEIQLIEKYLTHPSKEPNYRKSKHHRDFIAGIRDFVPMIKSSHLFKIIEEDLLFYIKKYLSSFMIPTILEQSLYLKRKIETK